MLGSFRSPTDVCMKRPLTDEDLLERASIDGRVAFAMIAFVAGAGLVALLDRIGVPEGIVGVLGPVLAIAGLAMIGLLMHAVRISRFYAAGRAVPAPYAAFANVALVCGFLLPFLPPSAGAYAGPYLVAGLATGFVLVALVTGPLLRKTGAFSLPDLIAARFPGLSVRLSAVTIVAAASLAIGVAGFELSVRTLEAALGLGRGAAAILTGVVLILLAVPGGLSGVIWGATGAAGILLAAIVLPLAITLIAGEALPLPAFGDRAAWDSAVALIATWQGKQAVPAHGLAIFAAVALGIAALAPLLLPSTTAHDASESRKAGVSAIAWAFVAFAIVTASLAFAAIAAEQWLSGERPDRLPAFAYQASGSDLLRICGKAAATPEAALAACKEMLGFAGLVLRKEDYAPSGLWLLLAAPELREFGVAFSGLAAAGLIAISLVLAGAGIQSFATAVGHDAFYRVRDTSALTSRRLATTRLVMIAAIAASGWLIWTYGADPRRLASFAIMLSAAVVAPLLALALWPRASGTDAAIALLCGVATAGIVIALSGGAPDIDTLAMAAVIAAGVAFIAGFATSFLHSGGLATEGSAFVHGVLHGETDVLHHDKGA